MNTCDSGSYANTTQGRVSPASSDEITLVIDEDYDYDSDIDSNGEFRFRKSEGPKVRDPWAE